MTTRNRLITLILGFSLLLVGIPSHSLAQISFYNESEDDANDLENANDYYQRGRYGDAVSLYQEAAKDDPIGSAIGLSRIWMMLGEYENVEETLRTALKESPNHPLLQSQLAQLLVETGRSTEALSLLESAQSQPNVSLSVLVQYGQTLRLKGQYAKAEEAFENVITSIPPNRLLTSENYAQLALAHWALENFHEANQWFREATRRDRLNQEAQLWWGNLFIEKYNEAEAQKSYQSILAQNENYLPALVGLAKVAPRANQKAVLDQALSINEKSVLALVALGEWALEEDDFDAAQTYLNRALETNPESIDAKILLAAIAQLKADEATYQSLEKAVMEFSPNNGSFYARIAEILGRQYRFTESVAVARRGIEVAPNYWKGHTVLGMNLLRLGEEEEGQKWLEFSFEKDPFNIWTKNMLQVLETLETFETRKTEHFIVKMSKLDADVLWPYLGEFLEQAWDELTVKYDFTPEAPILIEVFDKHEDFAVRTSGLPSIGPLVGVCFGKVITLDSPFVLKTTFSGNWKEIVWHEFVHVITLQMTKNRMPRWLSEGISVFEEHQGQPEWGRNQDLDLVKAYHAERLLEMKQLNDGFSKATSSEDLNFAYYQSYLAVEYIVDRFGFDGLKKLIHQYAIIQPMETIFQKAFNQTLPEFNEGFFDWLQKKVDAINVYVHQGDPQEQRNAHGHGLQRNSLFSLDEIMDRQILIESMERRVKVQPRDFLAHFQLGILLYRDKAFDEAIPYLKKAKQLLPQYSASPTPQEVLASIYEQKGDQKAMLAELEELVQFQQNDFEIPLKLAKEAQAQSDPKQATYYLNRALDVNPYELEIHKILAEIAKAQGQYDTAIREFKILITLDTTDPAGANTDLAEAYLLAGRKTEAQEQAYIALEIAPTYERAQTILLEALDL